MYINPVNWRTDTVGATFVYDRPLERPKPDTLRVACDPEHRLLVVSGFKNQEVLPVIGIPGNYHNYELRFYHPFIRKNIADRVAAWLKESSDRKPLTPAPEGKHPFAIIHYGCHGESCPELTEEGARRMREIAWRMAERFPEVINKDANHIGARSLRDTRSLLSMEQMMIQISRVCGIRVYHNATEAYSDFLNRQNLESCLTDPNGGALQHRLLQYLIHCTDTAKTFRQTAVFHIADKTSFSRWYACSMSMAMVRRSIVLRRLRKGVGWPIISVRQVPTCSGSSIVRMQMTRMCGSRCC